MDRESSNFVAALLRNMGVPGIVISPKGGAMPNPADVEATKSYIQGQFGGDRRGSTLVLGAPTEVSQFGFNPSRSEEHTSELQSLMRISYAVFCLKKKQNHYPAQIHTIQ